MKKTLVAVLMSAVAATIIPGGAAFARRGADDPAGHIRQSRGADNATTSNRQGRGADDPAGHVRHGGNGSAHR